MKKGSLYYERASALLAGEVAVSRDGALQTQLLLTQGLLLFSTEQVNIYRARFSCLLFLCVIIFVCNVFIGWVGGKCCYI